MKSCNFNIASIKAVIKSIDWKEQYSSWLIAVSEAVSKVAAATAGGTILRVIAGQTEQFTKLS